MVGATGFEPATTCTPRVDGDGTPSDPERIRSPGLENSHTSEASVRAPGTPATPSELLSGAPAVRAGLPSNIPAFLEACGKLAASAFERGDVLKAVELMLKGVRAAAPRSAP